MKRLNVDGYIIADQDKWVYDYFEVPYLTLARLRAFLNDAGKDDIELVINCYGGDVWAAAAMYAELRNYKGKSVAKVIGVSASASSFLMLGANTVIGSPMATIMIHNAQAGAQGDYRAMEHTAAMLKQHDETIRNAYEIKTKKSRADLAKYMDNETWLTVQDALSLGIIDEIDLKKGEELTEPANSALMPSRIAACFSPVKMRGIAAALKNAPIDTEPPEDETEETEKEKPEPNDSGDESRPVSDNLKDQKADFHRLKLKILKSYEEEK